MKKQIILLMTDTTRKDMVGCYGNKKMFTPNLDALAQEGIRYENAYTCQPVCGPARSAIFTGTFPHSNGMVTNGVPLGANVKTIGQRLTDNGIKCGYIGKWHLDGGDYFGLGCCPEGWDADYWYDMKCYLNELSENERVCSRQPNEFVFLSTAADSEKEFLKLQRDFEASLGVLKLPDGSEHPITVAMGYSVLTHNMPHSMDDVVRAADAKMYEAKRRMKTENRS